MEIIMSLDKKETLEKCEQSLKTPPSSMGPEPMDQHTPVGFPEG